MTPQKLPLYVLAIEESQSFNFQVSTTNGALRWRKQVLRGGPTGGKRMKLPLSTWVTVNELLIACVKGARASKERAS